ncbi:MAG: zinc-binding dehydrogenase [Planctomycetes bacterium]|nr:zinc-binding dehydrogenase [Planctomycetota bacterium]
MRAAVVRQHGGLDAISIERMPVPEPRPDEVLVRVKVAGLNHLDLWVRRGVPGHPFPLPMILGCDFAGVVERVGSAVRNAKAGDEVCVAPGFSCGTCAQCLAGADNLCKGYGIFGEMRDGGCAEFQVVPAANLLPKPAEMTWEQAAAWPLAFLTAWHMLVVRAALRPGETVLVHAAGSGVGSAAIQIAKILGARVIATASTEAKCERGRALGADDVIQHTKEDWVQAVKRLTQKRGVDVVFEHTGQATWEGSVKSLVWGGRLVTCGATAGFDAKFDLRVLFFKQLSFLGSTMGSRAELWTILDLIRAGKLRPVVDRVLPLDDIREAHRVMEGREAFGKVVVVP